MMITIIFAIIAVMMACESGVFDRLISTILAVLFLALFVATGIKEFHILLLGDFVGIALLSIVTVMSSAVYHALLKNVRPLAIVGSTWRRTDKGRHSFGANWVWGWRGGRLAVCVVWR